MLYSYFQNSNVSVTKETYFEMCEALGTEPVESEIPVELEDFPEEVQQAMLVYFKLRDDWDTMNGNYMGKSYQGLKDVLDILEIESADRKFVLDLIQVMDSARQKAIQAQKPKKEVVKTPVGIG